MHLTYANTITVEQYNGLRRSVNWNSVQEELARNGLEHAAFIFVVNDSDLPIGLARVITDYGQVVLIVDVIVHPDYQGKGIGRIIMTNVMEYINKAIAPGQSKFISLMAAKGKEGFYKKFGFNERPNDKHGPGMSQWIIK